MLDKDEEGQMSYATVKGKKPLEECGDTRKEGTWERWGRRETAKHILLEK